MGIPVQINPKMIVLAREYRGIQQNELAKIIGITPGFLSKIEKEVLPANETILGKLCECLNLSERFFTRRGDTFYPNLYYRKKSKTSSGILTKAEAEMNVHRLIIDELMKSIEITSKELPILDVEEFGDLKTIAKKVRQLWGIPEGPINNLFEVLERNGIIVVLCDFDSHDISGRSMFTDKRQPIIFINKNIPSDRQRFTAAHELCHLMSHIQVSVPEYRDIEKEAQVFASEFLVPEKDLAKQILKSLTLPELADLKRFWKVSMQAILYKANESKLITPNNHKTILFQINKNGMRLKEPVELDPPKEKPTMLFHLINLHLEDLEFSEQELSSILGLKMKEIKDKYMDIQQRKLKFLY